MGGRWNGELLLTGDRISVLGDENVWKQIVVIAAQHC